MDCDGRMLAELPLTELARRPGELFGSLEPPRELGQVQQGDAASVRESGTSGSEVMKVRLMSGRDAQVRIMRGPGLRATDPGRQNAGAPERRSAEAPKRRVMFAPFQPRALRIAWVSYDAPQSAIRNRIRWDVPGVKGFPGPRHQPAAER
ncbi:hypothetical protein GCM10018785_52790 [Streptomyces longispororuber]|uniref:Uncharacterized protein n=1 Tax=Streptomyces longispororuber TaxID=68230 RepID=A0A918ZYF2_9ACTN|nr:hypothetical protein GCM10018785_52790 [Streptomyces longispororuber]